MLRFPCHRVPLHGAFSSANLRRIFKTCIVIVSAVVMAMMCSAFLYQLSSFGVPSLRNQSREPETNIAFEYTPPEGERPRKRFSQALIIGFPKCGTYALLKYLSLHPYVVQVSSEQWFYDHDDIFAKGYDWYLDQMPYSYSDQLTLEKSPGYVRSRRAVHELRRKFPWVKLIVLVRDPIVRLLSQDAQFQTTKRMMPLIHRFVWPNGTLIENRRILTAGLYYDFLTMWYEAFPREQILVMSGEELIKDPLKCVQRSEQFLNLRPMFSEDNFVFNKSKGFYCYIGFGENSAQVCLGQGKGRAHRDLPEKYEQMLYNFYNPHNEKLFKLIGERFNWTTYRAE